MRQPAIGSLASLYAVIAEILLLPPLAAVMLATFDDAGERVKLAVISICALADAISILDQPTIIAFARLAAQYLSIIPR